MTDKEFKRLSRFQLIDIIYQLQVKQEELQEENRKLKEELEDKRIRVSEAGSIAEAAWSVHRVIEAAQAAADHYLEEIRVMREETEETCQRLVEGAQQEANAIMERANRRYVPQESIVDAILKEYSREV